MRRRTAITGLLFGGALFLAGCASATSGTVTSKQYTPSYTAYTTVCNTIGKSVVCIPLPYTEPECYEVNFHNDQEDAEGSECVAPTEYPVYRLGDHYPKAR